MRRRDGILAVVAVLSVVIYSLACRPAWHPDSDRVAFTFQENEVGGVVICDLRTGELKRIFEAEAADEPSVYGQCIWSADGKSVFLVTPSEDATKLIAIEEETLAVQDIASIDDLEDGINYLPPVLGSDRYLWLSMLQSKEKKFFCARIDLKTGEVQRFFESESKISWISEFASRGAYCFEMPSDEPEAGSIEVFTFDPLSGERSAAFKTDVPGELAGPFVAAEPEANRFACVIEREEKLGLLLFNAESRTELPLDPSIQETGYVLWDDDTIVISVGMEPEKEGATKKRAGLLSINLASEETEFLDLLSLGDDTEDDNFIVLMLQPAVSPDGRFVAVMVPASKAKPLTSLALLDLSEDSDEPVFITVPPKLIKDAPAEEHSETHEPAAEGAQENK